MALAAIEKGAEVPGEGQLPLAPILEANQTAAQGMVVLLYVGFAVTLVWALWKVTRERTWLPLLLVVTGVVAANIEPLGDHVGLIVYAPDIPWFDYWLMGRQMPSFILVAEASYVAFGCYYAAQMIAAGRSLRDIAMVSGLIVGIPEIVVEVLWHHWGMIAYYGDNPTRILGIPLYSIVQNTTLLPVYGVVTFLGILYLRGARILWLLVAIPTVTIGYIVGVSWPVYIAVQSSAPPVVVWIAAIVVCVSSVAVAYWALQHPAVRERRLARAAAPGDQPPTTASAPPRATAPEPQAI